MDNNFDKVKVGLIEIGLPTPKHFLMVKERLERIGIKSQDNVLWQTCHIFHKRNRYYLVHFKEMFLIDDKNTDISEMDYARRNRICKILEEESLIKMVIDTPLDMISIDAIDCVSKDNAKEFELKSKYIFGGNRVNETV